MLAASQCSAQLRLGQVPLLPGAAETLEHGIESTLAPDNRLAEAQIDIIEHDREMPQYAALFDPQTCGGLLIGVAESRRDELLAALRENGAPDATTLGQVVALRDEQPRIAIT
jgi:selenide,water dikinase